MQPVGNAFRDNRRVIPEVERQEDEVPTRSKDPMDFRVYARRIGNMLHDTPGHHDVNGIGLESRIAQITSIQLDPRKILREFHQIDANQPLRATVEFAKHWSSTATPRV